MTSLVFSFVYLISLYNPLLEDKKLYFFLFLMIQGLTLMSFLSTNILAFVIFFESSLLPMALIIGF
jgi:NADH:ubiquinone oxidoreductase subunit 4 (subunit M)